MKDFRFAYIAFWALSVLVGISGCSSGSQRRNEPNSAVNSSPTKPNIASAQRIDHVIILYLENHSFNNLMRGFPGADHGPVSVTPQNDEKGNKLAFLPPVFVGEKGREREVDKRFPQKLPNKPFLIDTFAPRATKIPDPSHEFYTHKRQINGGLNDRFVVNSNTGALAMGYYEGKDTVLWQLAQKYTLADHFFQGTFGGSLVNHIWLICGCMAEYEDAPEQIRAQLDPSGRLLKRGAISPDGCLVNTLQPRFPPYDSTVKDEARRLPPQTQPTIGDRLSEAGISWAWYAGGWEAAVQGRAPESFIPHHQPFSYFKNFAPGTQARADHLKDEREFSQALAEGSLPRVSFVKPIGEDNGHPGYSDLASSDQVVKKIVSALEKSPQFDSTLLIITFDEFGGFWDPLPPPQRDQWGPGTRIPTIFVSPWVKSGFVDHTIYDSTSILAYIVRQFGLKPLGKADREARVFWNIFR